MAMALSVMGSLPFTIQAAAPDHYISIKSPTTDPGADSNYNNDGARYDGGIAIGNGAKSVGVGALAIGSTYKDILGANAAGVKSIAIGSGSKASASGISIGSSASEQKAVSIGDNNTAKTDGISIGSNNKSDVNGITLGENSSSGRFGIGLGAGVTTTERSVAIGYSTKASGKFAIAAGDQVNANGDYTIATGFKAEADNNGSIATGLRATATQEGAIATGWDAKAEGLHSLAMGLESNAVGDASLAFGEKTKAEGARSVVLGIKASVDQAGRQAIAIGDEAYVGAKATTDTPVTPATPASRIDKVYNDLTVDKTGKERNGSAAIGYSAKAYGYQDTSLGAGAETHGDNSVAVGVYAVAKDNYTVALGKSSKTEGNNSMALGAGSRTYGEDSLGVGSQAVIMDYDGNNVEKATALGTRTRVISTNSVALGTESVADVAQTIDDKAYASGEVFDKTKGVVSVGDDGKIYRRITNVAGGAADHDAVNVAQLKAFQSDTNNQITNLSNTMNKRFNRLDKNIRQVGAGAAALAGLHPLDFDPDDKFTVAVAGGSYRDEQSFALGGFYRPNENTMFSIATTIGNNDNMVNIGASFKVGNTEYTRKLDAYKTAPISTVYVLEEKLADMTKRDEKQQKQIEEQQKQIDMLLKRLQLS